MPDAAPTQHAMGAAPRWCLPTKWSTAARTRRVCEQSIALSALAHHHGLVAAFASVPVAFDVKARRSREDAPHGVHHDVQQLVSACLMSRLRERSAALSDVMPCVVKSCCRTWWCSVVRCGATAADSSVAMCNNMPGSGPTSQLPMAPSPMSSPARTSQHVPDRRGAAIQRGPHRRLLRTRLRSAASSAAS